MLIKTKLDLDVREVYYYGAALYLDDDNQRTVQNDRRCQIQQCQHTNTTNKSQDRTQKCTTYQNTEQRESLQRLIQRTSLRWTPTI